MKALKLVIPILLLLVSGCKLLKKSSEEYKTGAISIRELKKYDWFKEEYKNYRVSEKAVDSLFGLNNVKITIAGGEWCRDTRLQLPRFIKILETIQFPRENLEIIFVNKEKQIPETYKNLQIKFVPTFIVIDKSGKELGRIVENPSKTLEIDLIKLISQR
jgi:thiol-disulfide isomerase/thioredoxin